RGSGYSPLVEAALEAADVPFYGGPGFTDDPDHRAFLRLLRAAHAGSDVRVGDVRPLLERLGATVDVDHDEKRLHAIDLPAVHWLTGFCDGVDGYTFDDALAAFESEAGVRLDAFRDELDRLGLLDEAVTEATVNQLEFYVQSYEVPVDRDNEGVLLADAKAAATVDRPAVFYLGMDEGWTHSSPRRPWVDRDAEFTRNLKQFQRLLQNGVAQYYLVQDERGGRAVTPCLYFEELLDDGFERFSDLEAVEHARTFQTSGNGFEREPIGVQPEPVDSISQSGLNRLVNCPRDHLFGRLVDGPDRDYFAVGNLFHDFAEVYVNHPEKVDETVLEEVVEMMLDATAPFDREVDRTTNRTRYRIGLETIVEFLDEHPPEGAGFLTGSRGWWTNDVADYLGLEVDAPHTEWWFDDGDLGLKGKIDLVRSPAALLDYKSGRLYSAAQVVGQSALDPPHDTPNFQALAYLAYLRAQNPDEPLSFTFFHFLETLDDVVAGEATLDDCLTTITYYPVAFEEYVVRESVFDDLCENGSGDCRKTFGKIEFGDYAEVIESYAFPDGRSKDELMESALGDALHRRTSEIVGEYKYVENGCGQALKHLRNVRDTNYFADDLDAFEAFVEERLDELNRYRAGEERFPVSGLGGEPNYRRVDHRDMIFEGDA
ncbi:MAG TPA: PD-(D/E)XK nuclease family protein, partial [Halobacteriales archaeon]|nr:PD-(D/E)XK nuclease family protein [Halobacteriales archaeon]